MDSNKTSMQAVEENILSMLRFEPNLKDEGSANSATLILLSK
jgi:hypothetical protein